jgi:hypothetical protein
VDYTDRPEEDILTSAPYIDEEVITLNDAIEGTGGNTAGDAQTTARNSSNIEEEFTTPLYEGAQISLGISLLLLMSFVIKHGLTDSAVTDLLQIISIHCPIENFCITSLYLFKKFFAGSRFSSRKHYYCSLCKREVGEFDEVCPNSSCTNALRNTSRSYFVEVSIEEQLRNLFKKPGFYNDLQYRFHRQKTYRDSIEDVYDGKLYQTLMAPGEFLTKPSNLSFQWNTDGVPLFHSSNYGMWPLYLKINELPPKKRLFLSNKILAGLWFGDSKPAVNTYFRPIYNSLHNLYGEGISVTSPDVTGPLQCRGIMLSGTCDMPAKAMALNMIGHNGFYGCPKCSQPGETYKTAKRGNIHVFPYIATNPHGPVRTSESVKCNAKESIKKPGTMVEGIRGPGSCLASLPHYDIVRGTSIDYMHCILINIVRLLISLWFDSTHSSELWSCSRYVSTVDARIESIQPPNLITRAPRGISKRKHWKASEYRSWLFFYSLPVMSNILHRDYYQHYALLCEAIYNLNSSIEPSGLKKASKLLQHFYFKFSTLYSGRYLSCNMHQILHLPAVVKDLGPLFTSSCFDHEDSNGKLAKMVHSHACIDAQILSSFGNLQRLSDLAMKYLEHDQAEFEVFIAVSSSRAKIPSSAVKINDDCYAVGGISSLEVDATLRLMLESAMQRPLPSTCSKFGRLLLRDEMFHSQFYKRPTKQNSYTVMYEDSHFRNQFGLISYFLLVDGNPDNEVFAVINPLTPNPGIKIADDSLTGATIAHIVPCYQPDDEYIVVRGCKILEKCVYMSFCDVTNCVYIAKFPNNIESD